jgi:hypothetical protein
MASQRHRRQLKRTVCQDRFIVTTLKRNRFMSAPKVANELNRACGVRISDQSVRNKLLQNINLHARKPVVAVHLTQHHRQTHVTWATTLLRWTLGEWNTVLFTDEFRCYVDFADELFMFLELESVTVFHV